MPVDRSYIAQFAYGSDPAQQNLFQALTQLANFSDGLETAAGVRVGASGTAAQTQAPAPAAASWTITASEGHYRVNIANPAAAGNVPIQHQLQSAADLNFNVNSSVDTFTLGLGQTTLDFVNPNVTRYWQLRSRYAGSGWNTWLTYANATGVVALNAGVLRTS